MSRLSAALLGLLLLTVPPAAAQAPSPLELVRGLREHGMADLALEYLAELEKKPIDRAVAAEIALERAKCQLEAADDEPDEGARAGLVAEAKEGFTTFLKANPGHPRAAEAQLALARLTSLEAKNQLAKAKKIEDKAREKEEAAKARPLFIAAAGRFATAAQLIDAQLKQPGLDPALKKNLELERFEADLSAGVNQFALADTYIDASAEEKKERTKYLDAARDKFAELAKGPATNRTAWVAKAWIAECEYEKDNNKVADDLAAQILAATVPEAEDGKRMVRYFTLRRTLFTGLAGGDLKKVQEAERLARAWLAQYGAVRRARAEAVATRWYLAVNLQQQGVSQLVWSKEKDKPPKLVSVPAGARKYLEEAERLYRTISQTDNEYSGRAARKRMEVVRLLLGEADKPVAEYKTFEEAQMASLIQMAKLFDLEKEAAGDESKQKDVKARRLQIVALLEHARHLATEKDNPADVTDVLLRLIYFYELTDQPYQAAILGEHLARTARGATGKPAVAGSMALMGYVGASATLKAGAGLDAAKKADRERAIELARFLDQKFPNDTATDRARHRLGILLYEDGKPVEAYDALVKVRAGYEQIMNVRLFQGAIAAQLLAPKDSPLPDARRLEVFRRTVGDLEKVVRPIAAAGEDEVRGYINARCRLALLYLLQPRVDPEAEKAGPGYPKARGIAEEVIAAIPSFNCLAKGEKLTIDGLEMKLLAEDARTRAAFLVGRDLFAAGNYDGVFTAIGPILAEMSRDGPYTEAARAFAEGAKMPAPKKEEPKKDEPKKDGAKKDDKKDDAKKAEPKKEEPKKEEPADDGEADEAQKARVSALAGSVDKTRRDLVVLALKARVKQGQADKAGELLDLLKKFGGSIEANVAVLQQLSLEIASQIVSLRKAGKADEANALTAGFSKLLDRVSAEPNLPPSVQLFIGQSLIVVDQHANAVTALQKVPKPEAGLLKAGATLTDEQKKQVNEYRVATLYMVRALRGAKKFDEAQNLINEVIGTTEKQGWGYASLDFRKEQAYLYEARGAAEPDPKKANEHWGKAIKEWTTLFNVARKRMEVDPKGPNGEVDNQQKQRNKNAFFEAYYDARRCFVKGNMQLLKGNPKLQDTFTSVAKGFVDLEKQSGSDIVPEVREKFHDLLNEIPELKKAYQAAGGKLFLEAPATGG